MFVKKVIISLLFMFPAAISAQYAVGNGSIAPLLALDDTQNRLQVWLVYGIENVSLRFTSGSSASHRWKKYREKALDAETVSGAVQDGTSSTLNKVEDGCGYFVEEEGVMSRYVWIIDYSKHAFSVQNLHVRDSDNPCYELLLDGEVTAPPLFYHTPLGLQRELKRTFEISYNTFEWTDNNLQQKAVVKTVEGDPFIQPLSPPLCDTEITLRGDLFARHFNVEQTASAGTYQAVAVEARIDTLVTSSAGANMTDKGGGLSAPVYVSFKPIANEPIANWFRWTVYHLEKKDTIRASTVREMDYTFSESGNYSIILETSDRTRKCVNTDSISISIGESFIKVPNAFSPGVSPGVNDVFKVAYKSLVSFRGWIYNRWGAELFYWSDPAQGWDGKQGGGYVPPGVYFYVIEAKGSDGKKYLEKGHINIIRSKNVQN